MKMTELKPQSITSTEVLSKRVGTNQSSDVLRTAAGGAEAAAAKDPVRSDLVPGLPSGWTEVVTSVGQGCEGPAGKCG